MVKSLIYFLSLLLLFVCTSLHVGSQEPEQTEKRSSIIIRNSDVVKSFDYNGRGIQRLLGNVILEQEENGVVVTCDSAYYYSADSVDLFSHVEMFQGAATIRCDKMAYDGGWARVRGNIVRMHKDDMTLLTQYFDYNIEQELGIYFNGGTVDRNGELLESDRGYYYAQTDLFMFAGNVAMQNEEYTIASDTMQYSMKDEDIFFLGPTKIWQGDNFLLADYGWQKKTIDETFFTGNVYICTPDKELWTDSLYYYQTEERGLLYGNIQAVDTVQSVLAFGDEGKFYNNPEFVELYENPAIAYYSKRESREEQAVEMDVWEGTEPINEGVIEVEPPIMPNRVPVIDTLFMVGDTIRSVAYPNPALYLPQDSLASVQPVDSVFRQMYIFPNMRAYRHDIQAVCDSLVFNTRDSISKMFVNPVIWSDTTQMSSDSIYFTVHNGALDAADFYSNPFIAMKEDSIRYSQVKGRNMKVFFIDNAVDRLEVYGNAQNIYYMRDGYEIENVNVSESANMTIYFAANQVKRVKYDYNVDSKIYPLDKQPEENKVLKGLSWQESRRPQSREDLFTRTVRSSQRIQVKSHVPPTFPITTRLIDLEKSSWIYERTKVFMPSLK